MFRVLPLVAVAVAVAVVVVVVAVVVVVSNNFAWVHWQRFTQQNSVKTFHGNASFQVCYRNDACIEFQHFFHSTKVLHQRHFLHARSSRSILYQAGMPGNTPTHHLIVNRICRLSNLQYPKNHQKRTQLLAIASKAVFRRGCGMLRKQTYSLPALEKP